MKRAALVISAVSFFVVGLWFIAIPEGLITDLVEEALHNDSFALEAEGLKKGLFYNITARRILLRKKGIGREFDDPLFVCDNVKGRADFLSLAGLNPELNFTCDMNGGGVSGEIRLTGNGEVNLRGNNLSLRRIPFLESLGIHGEAIFSGGLRLNNTTAELRFALVEARLEKTSLGGVFLPLDLFHDIKGAASMSSGTIEVRSATLSGNGVYARARGSVRGSNLDMILELMIDSSVKSEFPIEPLLEHYKVSPGYYIIPLKGEIPLSQG